MPERVQLRRTRGWRKPENTVVVARPGRWGNPFSVEEYGRSGAIGKYRIWIEGRIRDGHLNLDELRGKNLACWCPPAPPLADGNRDDEPIVFCHADVLLQMCDTPDE